MFHLIMSTNYDEGYACVTTYCGQQVPRSNTTIDRADLDKLIEGGSLHVCPDCAKAKGNAFDQPDNDA